MDKTKAKSVKITICDMNRLVFTVKSIVFLLVIITRNEVKAQDNIGTCTSNYSPTSSLNINPSSILDAKTWLDIHIVGGGVYLNNTLLGLKNKTLFELINDNSQLEEFLVFNQKKTSYHAYNRNFIQFFSAVWSEGNHSTAISFSGHVFSDARRIDEPIARFIEHGVAPYTQQHLINYETKRIRANILSYGEAKLTYANTFKKIGRNMFMAGVSLKKIFPVVGGALNLQELDYVVNNDSVISFSQLQGDIVSHTNPEFNMKGGWGIDLGFTYQKMRSGSSHYYPNTIKGGCGRINYRYKFGISINDIGYARFNKYDMVYGGYNIVNEDLVDYNDLTFDAMAYPHTLIDLDEDIGKGLVAKPHLMSLPTALNIYYDLNLKQSFFYLNVACVTGLRPARKTFGPRRANALYVAPRLETKWFDFALPISLYEYQRFQLGANMRIYCLTIGSDMLLNFFVPSDIYGADIYFHLKVPFFYNPKCKTNKRNNGFYGQRSAPRKGRKFPNCDAYR